MRRTINQEQRHRRLDLRFVAVAMWAIAGAFVAAAFIRAPAVVEAACAAIPVAATLAITPWALPRWKGTQRGLMQVAIFSAVQTVVIIALVVAFGR